MSYPEIPLELVLATLTLAAQIDKQTRLSLTYVSKEVQNIGDRMLYDDIFVGYKHGRKTTHMLKQMLSRSCMNPRFLRARHYITSFRSAIELGNNLLENLLIHCTILRLLVIPDIHRKSTLRIEPASTLRTIGFERVYESAAFVSRFQKAVLFRGVTHLVIEQIDGGDIRPLLHASNLTHLFLGCTLRSIPPWRSVTNIFPSRLRLCLVYLGFIEDPISNSRTDRYSLRTSGASSPLAVARKKHLSWISGGSRLPSWVRR
ncbi:hypothetical protein DL96DRAFT_1625951 [Flagelloscypha sp. PMI_526]|nr:hypothetical protein DL96DRAFT_1625951 [Flagelloscypha sp. PMI_526]